MPKYVKTPLPSLLACNVAGAGVKSTFQAIFGAGGARDRQKYVKEFKEDISR